MKERIRRRARDIGFDDCRFTTAASPQSAAQLEQWLAAGQHGEMQYLARNFEKRVDPQKVLPGAKSIVILATSYFVPAAVKTGAPLSPRPSVGDESDPSVSPEIARYARFDDYHDVLGEKLKQLSQFLAELGGPGARSLWYVDTGPLLERDLAQRAGMGFVGKHTNLISRRLGNWIFLSEVLTTLELEPDPSGHNHCGTCQRCLAACPTGAIAAPFQLDARRCISYLTIELKGSIPVELRPAMGRRIYGCDDCLAVCPWNRFAHEGQLMRRHARPELERTTLTGLLTLDEVGFKRQFAGTPIQRVKRRGLLRNVCVALGNVGKVSDLAALRKAASDPEPLIGEHAVWAMEQIEARERAVGR